MRACTPCGAVTPLARHPANERLVRELLLHHVVHEPPPASPRCTLLVPSDQVSAAVASGVVRPWLPPKWIRSSTRQLAKLTMEADVVNVAEAASLVASLPFPFFTTPLPIHRYLRNLPEEARRAVGAIAARCSEEYALPAQRDGGADEPDQSGAAGSTERELVPTGTPPRRAKVSPLTYDQVLCHLHELRRQLRPLSYSCAVVGRHRRGSPFVPYVDVLITHVVAGAECSEWAEEPRPFTKGDVMLRRALRGLMKSGYLAVAPVSLHRTCNESRVFNAVPRPRGTAPAGPADRDGADGDDEELHGMRFTWVAHDAFFTELLFRTGPEEFNARMMQRAARMGLQLAADGLRRGAPSVIPTAAASPPLSSSLVAAGESVPVRSERDIFRALQLPYIHPINRGVAAVWRCITGTGPPPA